MISEATFMESKPTFDDSKRSIAEAVLAEPTFDQPYVAFWQRSALFPLLPVLGLCAIANFLVAPLMDVFGPNERGAPLVYCCFGWIIAQFGILSVAMTLGRESFVRRLAMCWGVAGFLLVTWIAGLAVSLRDSPRMLSEMFDHQGWWLLVAIPLVFIGAQVPLWIARFSFGWRLSFSENFDRTLWPYWPPFFKPEPVTFDSLAGDGKLPLRDWFVTIGLFSLILGFGRALGSQSRGLDHLEFWGAMLLAGCGAALVSTVTTLPLVHVFYGAYGLPISWALATSLGFLAATLVLTIGLAGIAGFRSDAMAFIGYYLSTASLLLAFCLALTLLRTTGWRLLRGHAQSTQGKGVKEIA